MPRQTIVIHDEKDLGGLTAALGAQLKTGDVLTLEGDLGAGKTAFTRALINSLSAYAEEVPSPTFTLVQTYELPDFELWHFDLYRLEEEERDILELGWDDARRAGVCVVEWPQRLGGLLPKNRLEIKINFVKDSDNKREIAFIPQGTWADRFQEIT